MTRSVLKTQMNIDFNAVVHRGARPSIRFGIAIAMGVGLMGLAGCGSGPDEDAGAVADSSLVVEWMRHEKDGLVVESSARVAGGVGEFDLAGARFRILERWPHSDAEHEDLDDNPAESHAVELQWSAGDGDGGPQVRWIYQTHEAEGVAVLDGLDTRVRMMPAGMLPGWRGLWADDPRRTVQFVVDGKFYPLPADDGAEAIPGWKVRGVRVFEHALLGESGSIEENGDDGDGFTNRAVEVVLASDDGSSVERHIAFIDHPEITKGIHPSILPVSRVSGEGASNSRLVVRDPLDPPGGGNVLVICPDSSDPEKLTAFVWDQESKVVGEVEIDALPTELPLPGGQKIELLRHHGHARSVMKWRRREIPTEGDPLPALVIGWAEPDAGHKQAVLILNRAVPFRLRGEFQTFRFRR